MGVVKKEGNIIYVQQADKMRKVGEIISDGTNKILLVERDESKHLMLVWLAYGFAKEVLDHGDWFEYIQIDEVTRNGGRNTYFIPRKDIVLHSREYQSEGFERQYFITKQILEKYAIRA